MHNQSLDRGEALGVPSGVSGKMGTSLIGLVPATGRPLELSIFKYVLNLPDEPLYTLRIQALVLSLVGTVPDWFYRQCWS
jgi:hypothetical protein